MSKSRSLRESISYAFSGLKTIFRNEPNVRIHLLIAALTIMAGAILTLSQTEWIILLFTISFVLILEFINTSLEALTDIVSPQINREAKIAKDVSAAAVLISVVLSVIVGIFLFLPKILQFIGG